MTGRHLALASGPSLIIKVAGTQWQRMFPRLHCPAATQHLLPKAVGTRRRERFRSLGKLLGRRLFSAELFSRLKRWLLWERVRKAVLTPLCDLCWTALGGLTLPFLPEQEGPTKRHVPQPWAVASLPLQPTSLTSVCISAFWLGNHRKSSFIF